MFKLALAGAMALALSVPAFACEMTIEKATGMMDGNGVKYQIIEDADTVKALEQSVGLSGNVRALIGDFGNSYGLGFEGADGCLTERPIGIPKAGTVDPSAFGPMRSPQAEIQS